MTSAWRPARAETIGTLFRVAPLLVSMLIPLQGHASSADENARRPNVVLILADDMGWRDSGVYGSRFYKTPHLDQLAREGARFSNAYSASPLCSPTRAGLLTGLDPARLRLTAPLGHEQEVVLNPGVPRRGPRKRRAVEAQSRTRLPLVYYTLAEAMRDAGYATAHFGKWHLGSGPYLPEHQGFGHVSPGGSHAFPPSYFSPYGISGFANGPELENLDERLAAEAVTFMRAHRDEPFFLNFWLFSVHEPLKTRPELVRKYQKRVIPGDPQDNPTMAGMIETLDSSVGTLLSAVEELGLKEKTIVVFLSDNGGVQWKPLDSREPSPTSNAPLRGEKGQLYEGGVRVPLVLRWPRVIEAGVVRDQVVTSTDLYPTILELTGIAPRSDQIFDGISIVPALRGEPLPRDAIFTHFPHYMVYDLSPPGTSVRRGKWKLIRFYAEGEGQKDRLELYDLVSDLGEKHDVAAEHRAKVSELNGLIDSYLASLSALVPIPNPAYFRRDSRKLTSVPATPGESTQPQTDR